VFNHSIASKSVDRRDDSQQRIEPMAMGATMYVPVVHPAVQAVVTGQKYPGLRSVVLCLEDALHINDIERGMLALRDLLAALAAAAIGSAHIEPLHSRPGVWPRRRGGDSGPLLFVRPRNLVMAMSIAALPGIGMVDGLVVPKLRIEEVEPWWRLAQDADLRLMPTLENPWVLDPVALSDFADMLEEQDKGRLIALRVGGNDLLGLMGLRRDRGHTLYEGPLMWGLSQLMCQLGSRGHALTAPVFERLDDPVTLIAECRRDAAFGFIAKTAIHPSQIAVIESAFTVTPQDLVAAHEMLSGDSGAVFRQVGAMAEPATHRPWAKRIIARSVAYGVA